MLRFFSKPITNMLLLVLTMFLVSCGGSSGGGGGGNNPPVPPILKSITVTSAGNVTSIPVGKTLQFKAIANYTNKPSQDVTNSAVWSSTNSAVATIASGGLATGVESGTTDIVATFESVSSTPFALTVGTILISATTKLPYSMPISESRTVIFLVQNLTTTENYSLLSATPSVNGSGTAVIDSGQTTCGTTISPNESCIYAVDYTSPSSINQSGTLVDVILQVNAGSAGTIQASTSTFIANGTTNLQGTGLVPTKVIMIYNNDPTHTIYPVLETSRKLAPNFDSWLMAFFNTPSNPIYISGVYRVYIGGESGIAPGQYAALPLPLYSQFNTTQPNSDLYIDWWRGTRFYIYDNPVAIQLHMGKDDTMVNNGLFKAPIGNTKVCTAVIYNQQSCQDISSPIYQDNINSAAPANDPAQVVEPSLGSDGGIGNYKWDGTEIDYDVSYVNDLYLPLTLGKIDYSDQTLGWVGTDSTITFFQESALASPFMSLSASEGVWPIYTYSELQMNILNNSPAKNQAHIPSAIQTLPNPYAPMGTGQVPSNGLNFVYNRLLLNNQWMITSESSTLPYVNNIVQAWQNGIDSNNGGIVTIFNAFKQNYLVNCPNSTQPVTLAYAIPNMVGFASFGQCADGKPAAGIPLPNASQPGGIELINAFHAEMDTIGQTLNPWVGFIHDQLGLQSVYAYSIDDILGNVQTSGDGLMIEVGGANAQENQQMMLRGDKTLQLSFGGLPLNQYAYTSVSVCGLSVLGTTPFSQNGVSVNAIIGKGVPIYLPAVTGGNACSIQINGVIVGTSVPPFSPGTVVKANFTVANVDPVRSTSGAAALTASMKGSCTDNISGLFCTGVNASSTSTALLYTIAWPG